jgi:predicted nucleic acid-binding protein
MTLVDTNVLLDVATDNPRWAGWSLYQLDAAARGVLPDFFIGAHAAVTQIPLLTRDPRPYRTYFAGITLIAPDETEPV